MSRQDGLDHSTLDGLSNESSGDEERLMIDLREKLRDILEIEAQLQPKDSGGQPAREQLAHLACRLYDERQIRERVFAQGHIPDEKAWMMLLAIFCFPTRGEFLTVTGISMASFVSPTTGLRIGAELVQRGLIERVQTTRDGRKQFVGLTETGRDLVAHILLKILRNRTLKPRYPELAGTVGNVSSTDV